MIGPRNMAHTPVAHPSGRRIGTPGYLALLIWTFVLIFFLPQPLASMAAGAVLTASLLAYADAFRRLLRWRWLLLMTLLIVPNALWMYDRDLTVAGIPCSGTGLVAGLRMALRALVVILVIDIFSSHVEITEVAGLLERLGLKGLGFSMGIAVNLLPSLRESSEHTWHSLRMRGGLRAQRWQALRFLSITVITNALHRAEEIALAAETRAFAPGKARALPLTPGPLDRLLIAGCLTSFAGLLVLSVL
jgi:energy-coupling factor transporter transmembrane protein EcfT